MWVPRGLLESLPDGSPTTETAVGKKVSQRGRRMVRGGNMKPNSAPVSASHMPNTNVGTLPRPNGEPTAEQLVQQLQALDPALSLADLFRVGHLLTVHADPQQLNNPEYIKETWLEISWRLQAAADQQAAVSEELDAMASTDPQKFQPAQVWTLIKAIKVLSQTLEFYSR